MPLKANYHIVSARVKVGTRSGFQLTFQVKYALYLIHWNQRACGISG